MMNEKTPETLIELVFQKARKEPNAVVFYCLENNEWKPILWSAYIKDILAVASWLKERQVNRGDTVAIILPSCYYWDVLEKAILLAGGIPVGIEPFAASDQQEYLQYLAKTKLVIRSVDEIKHATKKAIVETEFPHISKDDPATFIFTSGTTGNSKPIIYTHDQFILAASAILTIFHDVSSKDRSISWFPLANLFQRMMNLCGIMRGTPIYFVEDPTKIIQAIQRIKPTILIGVPRFYEKIYNGIIEKVKTQPTWQQRLIHYAFKTNSKNILNPFFDLLIFKPMRKILGGQIRYMITGSASCPKHLFTFFDRVGITFLEAYGISENIIPVCINSPRDKRFGSVGKILEPNEVKLGGEEILVKGPGLFKGYVGFDTKNLFTDEGYYKTGDLGYFDNEGFLYITGRNNDVFIISTGRKISALKVQMALKQIPNIEQILIVGEGRKTLVALIYLDPKLPEEDLKKLILHYSKSLKPYEKISGCLVLKEPFSIKAKEVTTSLKLRRHLIEDKFASEIDELYRRIDEEVEKGSLVICQQV